jgi:hypothetical protein
MRLQQYTEEMKHAEFITLWEVQQQFHSFILDEIFDKDVELKNIEKGTTGFSTHFNIGKDKYMFQAETYGNNIYSILFYKKDGLEMFKPKGDVKFPGDVFSGVFKSIKKMINDRQVDGIHFNTDDSKLKSLYTKMKPLVIKRFPEFQFFKKVSKGNITEFLYLRKGIKLK